MAICQHTLQTLEDLNFVLYDFRDKPNLRLIHVLKQTGKGKKAKLTPVGNLILSDSTLEPTTEYLEKLIDFAQALMPGYDKVEARKHWDAQ